MKMSLTVCDVCSEVDLPTENYRITYRTKSISLDLCEEHRNVPLATLLDTAPPKASRGKGSPRGGRRPSTPVMTVEEIAQMKLTKEQSK